MTQEEDNSVVVIDGQVLGNTQYMAYVIQETVGADIFRIEPSTPYPTDHETLVDLADGERDENARSNVHEKLAFFRMLGGNRFAKTAVMLRNNATEKASLAA